MRQTGNMYFYIHANLKDAQDQLYGIIFKTF